MAEGQMGQETYNDMEQSAKQIENAVSPVVDKAIDKTAEKLANHFAEKNPQKNSPENNNNKKDNNFSSDNKKGPKENQNKDNTPLNKGKKGLAGDAKAPKDNKNGIKGKNTLAEKGKDAAGKAKDGAKGLDTKNIASGIGDKAGDMIKNTGRVNNGEASGEVVDGAVDAAADATKTAVKAGAAIAKIAASGGTDIKAWVELLKSGILKYIGIAILCLLSPIIVIIILIGNIISSVISKITEAFTFATVYDSFTMEDQYELLAISFGDEVFRAYESMLEDVNTEIDAYAADSTYNEWEQILIYNKINGRIDYTKIYNTYDSYTSAVEPGMPDATVYIGGYAGTITDSEWGVNGKGSGVDTASKTNPNYNKGLYKVGDTIYATGNEPYFDADETRDSIQANAGYAAVSDMAYLVAGYSVSMMEAPIIDLGTKVSSLEAGVTILQYKLDIAVRVFSNTADNNAEKFGGGIWGNILGHVTALGEWGQNKLAEIFDGETTFFIYDASLIETITQSKTRTVYEYKEKIYTIQEKSFTYNISYKYKYCDGHPGEHTDECPADCEDLHIYYDSGCQTGTRTTSYTLEPTVSGVFNHDTYLSAATYDGYTEPSSDNYKIYALNHATYTGSNVSDKTVTSVTVSNYGNEYYVNRSEYVPVTKTYNTYTLDIPMAAFDVDRILKALFETSPYYGELTYYYTDQDSTYSYVADETENYTPTKIDGSLDPIINKYGKYLGEWKYSYNGADREYTDYDGNTFTQSYTQGQLYDNGIDKQPYFMMDTVYLYDCDCTINFGVYSQCPNCGAPSQRSYSIKVENEEGDEIHGEGDRALTYFGTILVQQNGYFEYIMNQNDTWRTLKQIIRQNTMIAITTHDKKVIDDYTGEQVGGSAGNSSGGAGVVLIDSEGNEYYPITVLDRVLSLKNSSLQTLENSAYIQSQMASRGLTMDGRFSHVHTSDCYDSSGNLICGYSSGSSLTTSEMEEYVISLIEEYFDYSTITVLNGGEIAIGIGSWRGEDAEALLQQIINNNPDLYAEACESAGLDELDFSNENWNKASNSEYMKVRQVILKLLEAGVSEQNYAFKSKVKTVVNMLIGFHVTDSATLAYLSAVSMWFENPAKIPTAGGAMSMYREYVINAAISAGVDASFETAYSSFTSWIGESGNQFAGASLKTKSDNFYNKILQDMANGNLPTLFYGALCSEDIAPIIDLATTMTMDGYKEKFTYTQAERMGIKDLSEALVTLYETQTGHIKGDCSSFVAALYYIWGYNVPTSSASWSGNTYGYVKRTDTENMIPGDVIVWRNESARKGHVELYIGNGKSVGFGSEPPKVHTWDYFYSLYPTVSYYRIVD